MRDVICNEIPLVLRRELYACVSLATGVLYLTLQACGTPIAVAVMVALLTGFTLRMLAIQFHWGLPSIRADDVRGFD